MLSPRLQASALVVTLMAALPSWAAAQEVPVTAESRRALTLTVYNQNLGLVSESRRVDLPAGESLLAIEDVPRQLQPETVLLAAPGLQVIEQSLAADLLTPQRLLEASLGQKVQFIRIHPETGEDIVEEGRVLSLANGMVLQFGDRIEISPPGRIAFNGLPAGLRSEPALLARVFPGQAGPSDLQIDYLTGGLSWRADYVARLNAASDRLDLQALVTLTNATDSNFDGATLRLVAGEVNQAVSAPRPMLGAMAMQEADVARMAPAPAMSKAVAAADRYVYALQRPVTLRRGETKQIPLMSAQNVKVLREFRFEGLVNGHPQMEEIGPVNAALILELENDPDLGLGAPLPAGTVRVYGPAQSGARGASGTGVDATLFLGADSLDHTPEGEKARLGLGEAFDVTARAKRTVFERLSDRSYESGQQVTVKNAKDEPVEVVLAGQMPQGWRMLEQSAEHEQDSANRLSWRLTVPAGGEATLTYRIRVAN
ncbi:DUF4139 domain-containing protein [Pelagibius sp. CAU 1746]|uniref:DUF4139 domain-containing protein n=1 Tax=Pelagibius sp. CAU 1746 TaxID=3140370 RepID=UPI00325BA216